MIIREMPILEFKALLSGKIPAFDLVYDFGKRRLTKTVIKNRFGVINRNYEVVLENRFDEIFFTENDFIITLLNREYKIYTKEGYLFTNRVFKVLHEASDYAKFF